MSFLIELILFLLLSISDVLNSDFFINLRNIVIIGYITFICIC